MIKNASRWEHSEKRKTLQNEMNKKWLSTHCIHIVIMSKKAAWAVKKPKRINIHILKKSQMPKNLTTVSIYSISGNHVELNFGFVWLLLYLLNLNSS